MPQQKKGQQPPSGAAMGHPVTVQLSPPAYQVRQQAGLGMPNGRQLAEAMAGVIGGAIASAFFITAMNSPSAKWVGAILTGGLGAIMAATSPIGTFAEEAGFGAAALSAGWMYFDATAQFAQPSTSTSGPAVSAPVVLPTRRSRINLRESA